MKMSLNDSNKYITTSTNGPIAVDFNEKKRKHNPWDVAFVICNSLFLIIFTIVTLYPVINTLAVSLNNGFDALRGDIYLWPRKFTTENYLQVFQKQTIWTGFKISLLRTALGSSVALICNAFLAFVISRKKFVLRSQVSLFWVITMYVNGGMVPYMILFRTMHLTTTFWVYIIPSLVGAFNVLVIRTYMEGLPDELEESPMLDGAGYWTIFYKIITPLCKPVYATIFLFIAVGHWNSWFDTMLYNRNTPEYTTLQYELMKLLDSVTQQSSVNTNNGNVKNSTPTTVRAAASIFTMAPIIMIYPFLQRYFVTGLTIGGVKG